MEFRRMHSESHSGDVFPAGQTIVTVAGTDAAGNTGTANFKVTVTDDTAPVVTAPADVAVSTGLGATSCNQSATWTAATATDNCTMANLIGIKYFINYESTQIDVNNGYVFYAGQTMITVTG